MWPGRRLSGAFWILIYCGLVTAPVLALLWGERPPGLGFWWDLSIGLGFAGAAMMSVQFVLTARFRRGAAPFGIDVIYYFHRYLAVVLLIFVVAHPALLLIEEPALVAYLDPRSSPGHMQAGVVSVLALIGLMVTSLARKRLRLGYDRWRQAHAGLAVIATGGALAHMTGVGYYMAVPAVGAIWGVVAVSLVGLVVYVRAIRPWLLLRHPYRVSRVVEERGDAWTLSLEPVAHAGFTFQPGQFVWLTIGATPFSMREHPFSISSAPDTTGRLEVTIKALGDFTSTVGAILPGSRAYVDGPYGAFSIDRHPCAGFVFAAGGIGIAPIMSFLRTMADRADARPVVLFYAYRRWDRMTHREAIEALRARLTLTIVYVLDEPPEGWTGERGRIGREMLERHLPAKAERGLYEYFVCGPTAMIDTVERSLHRCGVPLRRLRSELFDLA